MGYKIGDKFIVKISSIEDEKDAYYISNLGWYPSFVLDSWERPDSNIDNIEDGYVSGARDAWEAAKEIIKNKYNNGCSSIRSAIDVFDDYKPLEAIKKIGNYKEMRTCKLGDEVIYDGNNIGIVIQVNQNSIDIMNSNGNVCRCWKIDCKKTNRHYDQIEKLFEIMKNSEKIMKGEIKNDN